MVRFFNTSYILQIKELVSLIGRAIGDIFVIDGLLCI
jgi:hypothetical protein